MTSAVRVHVDHAADDVGYGTASPGDETSGPSQGMSQQITAEIERIEQVLAPPHGG